jgi:hypothetical protein
MFPDGYRDAELTKTTSYQVHSVMMRQVHGRPPQPHGVEDVYWEELGEQVSHEQRLEGCPSRVQRGESAKHYGGGLECGSVEVDAEELVNGLQPSRISCDRVVRRCQSVRVLIPRRRAGKDCLDQNSRDVHVSESTCEDREGARRAPNEHAAAHDERRYVVDDSIGYDGKEVEERVFVCGEDVAQIGAVEDVLEGGQNADPDSRTVVTGDISVKPLSAPLSHTWWLGNAGVAAGSELGSQPRLPIVAQGCRGARVTYLQLENRSTHVRVGSRGRRNCRVMGRHRPVMSRPATNVFANGPGDSLTDRAKMATMARNRYCASYIDHGCVRSDLSVSEGDSDISSPAMDDVTDWRLRIRDLVARHLRRMRCGMKLGSADRPGTVVRDSMSPVCGLSRKAR